MLVDDIQRAVFGCLAARSSGETVIARSRAPSVERRSAPSHAMLCGAAMDGPSRVSTPRHILLSTLHVDTTLFEGMAALRCTVGVAIVLALGLVLNLPSVSAFGAVGAVSVGFGSFQGAYRSRAAVMIAAAAGMAISNFIGALAGHSSVAAGVGAAGAAFLSGMTIALGPATAFVALQSCVAVLVAGGFPLNVPDAARAAAI